MKKNTFFFYPRDKSGKYTGVSVSVIVIEGRPFVGVAITSKDDQFSKKKGRAISTGRAVEQVDRYYAIKHADPREDAAKDYQNDLAHGPLDDYGC